MAKLGEGDARWIVKDLGEGGRNVNQWHWTERDATRWAKERVKELLVGAKLGGESEPLSADFTGLDSWEGDVTLNIRKSKLIAAYELDFSLSWKGQKRGDDGAEVASAEGKLQVPYLSEENADEDPELRVTTTGEGPDANAIRAFVADKARPVVHAALRTLVKEIHAGGGAGGGGDGGVNGESGGSVVKDHGSSAKGESAAVAAKPQQPAAAAAAAKKPAAKQKKSYTSLSLKETFNASPKDIYDCFTDPRRVMGFTQSPANVEPVIGGRLSMYGGAVECTFTDLDPGRCIRMDWRFNTWADGVVSKVDIDLESPSAGTTTLTMRQTGIPEEDRYGNEDVISNVERGWQQQIFHRIKAVFGYGI